jgi:pimeloyl-ACP methyl ester carboxylesterase
MDDAIGIYQALGGDERAVVIGHDWGALTANGLGAYPGSPFRRVVSMSIPPIASMTPTRGGLWHTLRFASLLLKQMTYSWYIVFNQIPWVAERSLDRVIPLLWRRWSRGYDATADVSYVLASLDAPENRSAALGYYRALAGRGKVPERYREAQRFWIDTPQVPTLYVHGNKDGALAFGFTARVRDSLPEGSAVVYVPNAGHFLQLEQPAVVNEAILKFLRG